MLDVFLESINKLSNCGVFHTWPQSDLQFKRFNLIYGWNGTGKTTLSRILRSLEKGELVEEFKNEDDALPDGFTLELSIKDRDTIKHTAMTGYENRVRVFNCDFVRDNLDVDNATATPVYYLGEDQGKALKELKEEKPKLEAGEKALTDLQERIEKKKDSLGEVLKAKASAAKSQLSDNSQFDRRTLKAILDKEEFQSNWQSYKLSDQALQEKVDSTKSRGEIEKDLLSFRLTTDIDELIKNIDEITGRTITRKVIEELEGNEELRNWAQQGLGLHTDRDTCALCSSDLKDKKSRIDDLNAYFNDEYKTLERDVNVAATETDNIVRQVKGVTPFDAVHLFPAHQENYKSAVQTLKRASTDLINNLNTVALQLKQKPANGFSVIRITELTDTKSCLTAFDEAIQAVNVLIIAHNTDCQNQDEVISNAKEAIKNHHAAEVYEEYCAETEVIEVARGKEKKLSDITLAPLRTKCADLEKLLRSHYPAIDAINELLKVFMGRTDIVLEANEDEGYTIKRNDRLAKNLSEGEKTAIAFCFFISKMKEDKFEMQKSIVVIDDPISSLDTNALYAASGFIKRYLENVNQLFMLTHNHRFFREMIGWDPRPANISKSQARQRDKLFANFMIKCTANEDGKRKSELTDLDPLLKEYDSEYLYYCKLLLKAVENFPLENEGHVTGEKLTQLILLPNIARKALEAFLLFKYPADVKPTRKGTFSIYNKGKEFTPEPMDQDKLSILDRLLNYASHAESGKMSEIDMHVQSETPKVIRYVLEFIEKADPVHFKQIKTACGEDAVNDNSLVAAE